ncbi:MAG: hypothetical protein PHT51_01570 [Patescibacteria group bacterium]|nr:hypothetical protein [Patescibacteria group bacterium]MDD4611099.1 hypothetical protein [Patescibacteria group bacterium]
MRYFQEQTFEQVNARTIAQFLAMVGLVMLLPFYIHIQWFTGPIINALLILILILVGLRSALIACFIPSIMALTSGLLPAVFAPALPFIMISNVIFILAIDWIYYNFKDDKKGYWIGVFTGALLKFIFLYASINMVARIIVKEDLTIKIAQMMGWMQFFTAIAGGAIAWGILKWLRRL